MGGWYYDDYPSREVLNLRAAWRAHYIAKGCNPRKAFWLAQTKTHTWPTNNQRSVT